MSITKEQIIQEIQAIASRLGQQHVRQRDWKEHSSISISSVRYHFGNWNSAPTVLWTVLWTATFIHGNHLYSCHLLIVLHFPGYTFLSSSIEAADSLVDGNFYSR